MPDNTIQISGLGTHAAPLDYPVTGDQVIGLTAVRAVFDGTGAATAFKPCVQILSGAGTVMSQTLTDQVAAGASADVTFFPFRRRLGAAAKSTAYETEVQNLRISNQLIAQWRLTEGATPYADTSGYAPGDPATMARVVNAVAMTQSYTPAALSNNQDPSAVAFNADGFGGGVGDYLQDQSLNPSRFDFAGIVPYSVVAWVRPFAGAASSLGPVCRQIALHAWAPPAGTTRGWQIGVVQPGQTPYFLRYPDVGYGAGYPAAVGAAISANVWHMIVGTYDGANLRIYTDGALAATAATVAVLPVNGNSAFIGTGQDTTATGSEFYGAVGEVTVWGSALGASDIAALYTAGTA